MLDLLRWLTITEGVFALGTIAALYKRVWRFGLPVAATRIVLAAGAITVCGYTAGAHDRLGHPLTWRDPLTTTGLTGYLVGLVLLYAYYRQPIGRKRRHAMIAEYNAERMLQAEERRHKALQARAAIERQLERTGDVE